MVLTFWSRISPAATAAQVVPAHSLLEQRPCYIHRPWGSCSMSGTASMQGRELGTGETRRNAHKMRHLHCLCSWTLSCQSCAGGKHRHSDYLTSGGRRFQTMSKESDGPQGLENREPRLTPPEPIHQEGIITFLRAGGVSAQWTQRFPLQHHGSQLD